FASTTFFGFIIIARRRGVWDLVCWIQVDNEAFPPQKSKILLHPVAVSRLARAWGPHHNLPVQDHSRRDRGGVSWCGSGVGGRALGRPGSSCLRHLLAQPVTPVPASAYTVAVIRSNRIVLFLGSRELYRMRVAVAVDGPADACRMQGYLRRDAKA
ncbi:hypothetical protein THAOC_12213, partial [Thalassiosira oceanica]